MKDDVILYSTGCPRCSILGRKLDEAGIDYTVCTDTAEIEKRGFMSVPVLQVGEKFLDFGRAIKWANNPKWN